MTRIPDITVQIIHIQGPLKNQIQELNESPIRIGRKSNCQVRFPNDLDIVSRAHAEIVRDGNRFKIIDQSANGTFLNGKEIKEAYLKDGDVLMFAEDGPKISFLTVIQEAADSPMQPEPQAPVEPPPIEPGAPPQKNRQPDTKVAAPLIIQYGPTLNSFKELPITIGRAPECDYVLDHPAITSQHARISFADGDYRIQDLSEKQLILINDAPIQAEAPLTMDAEVTMAPEGPRFRFLGNGRLAEIEPPAPDDAGAEDAQAAAPETADVPQKNAKSILKKFWQR